MIDRIFSIIARLEFLWGDEDFEAASVSRRAAKQSPALQIEHHLVNGRRGDCEEPLHVGLNRRASTDLRIGVNERTCVAIRGVIVVGSSA